MRKLKITFVLPAIGKKKGEKYLRSWKMEPLTLAVLKSLTPKRFATEFFDDRIELIDFDTETDIVALTLETYTAQRAYEIARRFKTRGKLIIMGGFHATLCPEETAKHCDILVKGNAEGLWSKVLEDVESGNFTPVYEGCASLDYGLPDRSIYADKMSRYLPVSLVETGRGCRHSCGFCCIQEYYGRTYYPRKISDIITEIKQCRHKTFFLVDDSIFSDKVFALELFTELKKLNIRWSTQITLDAARDEGLLKLMKESGCQMILIGFESIDEKNLRQMNKMWLRNLGETDRLIDNVHRAGICIYASFVFGFDNDFEKNFEDTLAFARRHKFFVAAFNHLLAFPGTQVYADFKDRGRLRFERWWAAPDYQYGDTAFTPAQLTPQQLRDLCRKARKSFYRPAGIAARGLATFMRTKDPLINLLFWWQNILFAFEVDNRFAIPVGKNLDELPK